MEELQALQTDEECKEYLRIKKLTVDQIARFERDARKYTKTKPTPKQLRQESAGSGQGKRTLTWEMQDHLWATVVLHRGEKPLTGKELEACAQCRTYTDHMPLSRVSIAQP